MSATAREVLSGRKQNYEQEISSWDSIADPHFPCPQRKWQKWLDPKMYCHMVFIIRYRWKNNFFIQSQNRTFSKGRNNFILRLPIHCFLVNLFKLSWVTHIHCYVKKVHTKSIGKYFVICRQLQIEKVRTILKKKNTMVEQFFEMGMDIPKGGM